MKKRAATKPAITVTTCTMPANERCAICMRYGEPYSDAPIGAVMPRADRRGAARMSYRLRPSREGDVYQRLSPDPKGDPGNFCYVCGPCRRALRGRT